MAAVQVDSTTQRFTSAQQPEPDVVVEHTTEVMAWPPYGGGGEAPHATIWPLPGQGIKVREHIPFTQYAKALMNLPGGVETNRRGVIQFELVGTCDPAKRGKPGWYYWPDADDVVLKALADYQRPIMQRFGIPFTGPKFLPYPDSYGTKSGQRMTGAEWNAFQGVCGHQHVPENDHGDPGAFPISRFLTFLRGAATIPTVQEDDMPAPKDLWDYKIVGPDGKFVASAAAYLTYGNAKSGQAARDAGAALAVVKALAAKPAGLTAEEIEAAAKAGAKAALEEEIDSATVVLNTTKEP